MSATINLLDKYKKACSITADNACAVSLHVTRATVSGWRLGKSHPDAESVEKMCNAMQEPLRQWLPLIEAERARTPAARKVWLRLAQAAAAIVMTVSFGLLDVQTASAAEVIPSAHNPSTLYIMSNRRKWRRALGTVLAWSMARKGVSPCSTGSLTA
jgi:transcriptional regulator with XRE-family HTH domain